MIKYDNTYDKLPPHFFKPSNAKKLDNPLLAIFNDQLALDLFGTRLRDVSEHELAAYFSGQVHDSSMSSISMAYSGHQFGYFNPTLGDGRAILLGEILTQNNERFDLQLKGSGRTPFSRSGDGLSALGPVIREYIISEAMFSLGVPTTRSLAVIKSGEIVQREIDLPGGILTRVASSHIRVGTFEYLASHGDITGIDKLARYCAKRHFPSIETNEQFYLNFLKAVALKMSRMVSDWMALGFIHGVMNTDNMSIAGETLDYGPCAFIDNFNRARVFSSIDRNARYAYNNQVNIAKWNFTRLASCLLPLIHNEEQKAEQILRTSIESYLPEFDKHFREKMLLKIGISKDFKGSEILINQLFDYLEKDEKDFTETFKSLETKLDTAKEEEDIFIQNWLKNISTESSSKLQTKKLMQQNNPCYIPRNHLVEEAIQRAYQGDYEFTKFLTKQLRTPYTQRAEADEIFKAPRAEQRIHHTFCGT